MADLNNLLNEAKFILAKAKVSRNESRLRGEQFNIFHACGVNHYETKHSAIIAEFLNPEGSHGQGDIYLKEFLATFGENEMLSSFDTSTASVTTEYAVPNGRLDLLITNIKNQAIIIENKIYAEDQWEQLKRYKEFAEKKYRSGNYVILYLTLWGDEASKQSGENVAYICISYKETILKWLERCIQLSAQKPLIRETMIQYTNLIKELTHQAMEQKYKNEFLELMANNAEIVANIYDFQYDYLKYIWENLIRPELQRMAKSMVLEYDEYNMSCQHRDGKSFTFRKPEWKDIAIRFQSDNRSYVSDVYFGIVSLDGKHPGPQQKLDLFSDGSSNHWPYGNVYLDQYRYWDMKTLADMVNHTDKFVNYIKEKMQIVLDELARKGIKPE